MQRLSEQHLDVIRELFTLGAGKAADVLNTYLESHIQLSIPSVDILSITEIKKEYDHLQGEDFSSVEMTFTKSLDGSAELIFMSESASRLVDVVTGSETAGFDFDEIKAATFSEIGNIIINAVMGTVMNELDLQLTFSIPNFIEGPIYERLTSINNINEAVILRAKINFNVEKLSIEGSILFFFSVVSFDTLLSSINAFIYQP